MPLLRAGWWLEAQAVQRKFGGPTPPPCLWSLKLVFLFPGSPQPHLASWPLPLGSTTLAEKWGSSEGVTRVTRQLWQARRGHKWGVRCVRSGPCPRGPELAWQTRPAS